jgi:hypothetical protein
VSAITSTSALAQSVIASNISSASGGNFQPFTSGAYFAQEFQTQGSLDSITSISLSLANPSPAVSGMRVFTNNGGVPGVGTGLVFSTPGNSPSFVNATFNFVRGPALSPSTSYWIVVSNAVSSTTILNYTTATTRTGGGFLSGDAYISNNSGTSWSVFISGTSLMYSVLAVPEPSKYALGVGAVALGFTAYRRRKHRTLRRRTNENLRR